MEKKPVKIDELTIDEHFYLALDKDECYYFGSYYPKNIQNPDNSVIYNLKKKPSQHASPSYHYKTRDIKAVAKIFEEAFTDEINNVTFVPVPPSKIKGHPDYDDRMTQILKLAFDHNGGDIRELIKQKASTIAVHENGHVRPSISELEDNLEINQDENLEDLKSTIFLVDDVITTGAHFKAIKNILKEEFEKINIVGIFICRRVITHNNAADDFYNFDF